jgi:(p)ppGpp synthase/HD superfamily hydrolase
MLDVAIRLAVEYHAGQTDKVGAPYILHPLRVMEAVRQQGEQAMTVAVLHDIVEDTPVTLDYLSHLGFPDPVVRAVDLLTRPAAGSPDRPTYQSYVQRIVNSGPGLAIFVKIADLRDNLRRVGDLPIQEQGIARRYEQAIHMLMGGRS